MVRSFSMCGLDLVGSESSNSDTAARDGDYDGTNEFRRMALQQFGHAADVLVNCQLHQSDDGAVRQFANKNEFAEILVFGD